MAKKKRPGKRAEARNGRDKPSKLGKTAGATAAPEVSNVPPMLNVRVRGVTPKAAQPVKYSDDLAAEFCARIAEGQTMVGVCKAPDMPTRKTIFVWLGDPKKAAFVRQYEKAVEASRDAMAEEMIAIADRPDTENGAVNRDRLKVDTRKWYLSKVCPKKYGDKLDVNAEGTIWVKRHDLRE